MAQPHLQTIPLKLENAVLYRLARSICEWEPHERQRKWHTVRARSYTNPTATWRGYQRAARQFRLSARYGNKGWSDSMSKYGHFSLTCCYRCCIWRAARLSTPPGLQMDTVRLTSRFSTIILELYPSGRPQSQRFMSGGCI